MAHVKGDRREAITRLNGGALRRGGDTFVTDRLGSTAEKHCGESWRSPSSSSWGLFFSLSLSLFLPASNYTHPTPPFPSLSLSSSARERESHLLPGHCLFRDLSQHCSTACFYPRPQITFLKHTPDWLCSTLPRRKEDPPARLEGTTTAEICPKWSLTQCTLTHVS